MARNELIFRGLILVGAEPTPRIGELWAVLADDGPTVVAFVRDPERHDRLVTAGIARGAELSATPDERLTVVGLDGTTFAAAIPRQALGAWTGQKVKSADGTVIAEGATVAWSTQDVTVQAAGSSTSYPGAKTFVVGNQRWIEAWDGDPAARLEVVAVKGGCGCSKGRR